MEQRKNIAQAILFAACFGLIATGCNKKTTTAQETVANVKSLKETPANAGPLSLSDFKVDKNAAGNLVVKGLVSNTSPEKISHAEASFKLFDKDGKETGETIATVDNLEVRFSWAFEATISNESTTYAKFSGFTTK